MSARLRVLLAVPGFPPRQNGGTEWETYRRAQGLLRAGHEAVVFTLHQAEPLENQQPRVTLEEEMVDGIPVFRLPLPLPGPWGDPREFDDPLVYEALAALIDRLRPNLVHVASGYRLTLAALRASADGGVPSVLSAMDYWLVCPRVTLLRRTGETCDPPEDLMVCVSCLANDWRRYRKTHEATRGLSSIVLRQAWRLPALRSGRIETIHSAMTRRRPATVAGLQSAARIIVASRFLAMLLANRVLPSDRLTVMRQGLDMSDWAPAPVSPREDFHVGFIGQIAAHKGLSDLMDAFEVVARDRPGLKLLVFGDHERAWPADREALQARSPAKPSIRLMGRFANADIRRVHAQLDVLVVPSRWYENSPNVILEAFACGTPVITADLGGMAELVEHGVSGLLFDPARPVEGIAAALAQVIDHPGLLARLRAGLPTVKTLDEELGELEALYRQVLAERAEVA